MADQDSAHRLIVDSLMAEIGRQLASWPHCRLRRDAAVELPGGAVTADIAVTLDAPRPGLDGPLLLVEVMTADSEAADRARLEEYRRLAGLRDVLLVDAGRVHCELHHHGHAGWQVTVVTDPAQPLWLSLCEEPLVLALIYSRS